MSSVMPVECDSAPDVPTTENANVPRWALRAALMVSVLAALPLAVGVTDAGLKLQVTRDGSPEQARPTAFEKPLTEVTVQVVVVLALRCTLRLDGLQASVKSAVGGAGTVSDIAALRVSAPLVPTTWNA